MLPIALTNGSISGPVESVLGWRLEDDAGRHLFNGAGANETDRRRFFCPTIRGHLGFIASLIDVPFPACPVPPLPLSPVPASSWYALSLLSSIFPLVEVRVLSWGRSEEHTSELQSRQYLVCRLLLEKKKGKHSESGCLANVNSCRHKVPDLIHV